ncbi:hypothetical protein [Pseudonocardia sp. KRD291]|uniref:hypothetical protein n=1 Tax=Pseudonocardia sp. KRD291 TaxID=2792007 RepID=UPI001C49D627|nr:hypothetical protein [Pseudonocardia sp. KRD291]MBW0104224.1 hypothetical protein [Pseudonocardia sp. KRD291]
MLKKAGIVVAASAASLLALSPLAFADSGNGIDKDSKGIVSGLNGNNAQVPVQACNNNVPVNVLGVQVPVEDGAAGNGLTGAVNGESESGDSATDQSDNCGQTAGAGDSAGN